MMYITYYLYYIIQYNIDTILVSYYNYILYYNIYNIYFIFIYNYICNLINSHYFTTSADFLPRMILHAIIK